MVSIGLWVDLLLHHIIDCGGEASEIGTCLAVGIVGARTTRIELHILKARSQLQAETQTAGRPRGREGCLHVNRGIGIERVADGVLAVLGIALHRHGGAARSIVFRQRLDDFGRGRIDTSDLCGTGTLFVVVDVSAAIEVGRSSRSNCAIGIGVQNLLARIGPRRHLAAVVESHLVGVALGIVARDGVAADGQGTSLGRVSGPGWARGQGKLLIGDVVASLRPCAVLLDAQLDIDEILARLVGHGLQRQGDAC